MELSQTSHVIRSARPGPHPLTTEASELLARWSADQLLLNESRTVTTSATSRPAQDSGTIPIADEYEEAEQHDSLSSSPANDSSSQAAKLKPTSLPQSSRPQPASWKLHASQIGASLGALLMTCGTGMVIAGHYSGQPRRAVTGWLLATLGQMILFLGVISLVFQGLEQLRADFVHELSRFRRQLRRREKTPARTAAASSMSATASSAPASTAPDTIHPRRRRVA